MTTANDIAVWLVALIRENDQRPTYQSRVAQQIREQFGEEWLYRNNNDNPAIHRDVLKAFTPLKDEFILWDRSSQYWHVVTPEQLAQHTEREAARKAHREDQKARKAAWDADQAALRAGG